ncbi:MAG: hypothetical protein ACAI25_02365 [Planctomycetota bacterium]
MPPRTSQRALDTKLEGRAPTTGARDQKLVASDNTFVASDTRLVARTRRSLTPTRRLLARAWDFEARAPRLPFVDKSSRAGKPRVARLSS